MYLSEIQIAHMGFATVGKDVKISDRAVFYNPSKIYIDDHVRIDDFAILSAGYGGIFIGRYVHIACHTSIIGKGKVTLSDYSGISSRVAIYSSSDSYDGEYMTNPCLPSHVLNTKHESVFLGKHVVVGTGSTILPGVVLKDGCAVGAMSLVNKSFEDNSIIVGIPAQFRKHRSLNIYQLEKSIE